MITNSFKRYINRKFGTRILSRWVVFLFDLFVSLFTYGIAYVLRYNFSTQNIVFTEFSADLILTGGIYAICFLIFRSFDGIIRHSGTADIIRLIRASAAATVIAALISITGRNEWMNLGPLPISIAIIHAALNISILSFSRYAIKVLFYSSTNVPSHKYNVIIFGAGSRGASILQNLRSSDHKQYNTIAFIDDNPYKINKSIEGIRIYSMLKLSELIEKNNVRELIIAIQDISPERRSDVANICLEHRVKIKYIPPMMQWHENNSALRNLRTLHIEDLLGRPAIILDKSELHSTLYNKVIFVTGAAGSIGSELVRQIIPYGPERLILIDQAETGLYDLKMELEAEHNTELTDRIEYIIADIVDRNRMMQIFTSEPPDIVFHVAAYKHVPLMEINPLSAIEVNIFGTRIIADLCVDMRVDKCVFISTDKAVNPANIMGATKRVAEIYIQELSKRPDVDTVFITTRFGNVLGSNGSVVQYFQKQIEQGGPVTITHPDVMRYFMTIPEASNLVLEAAAMGRSSEIYLFDMGEPVHIIDLARKMVLLSGRIPETEIPFQFTGLRPGEKLYEELLSSSENSVPTHHPKIKIALTAGYDPEMFGENLDKLRMHLKAGKLLECASVLKEIVPEFISKNSAFEELDSRQGEYPIAS